jgi:hypothetical protein
MNSNITVTVSRSQFRSLLLDMNAIKVKRRRTDVKDSFGGVTDHMAIERLL